MRLESRHRDIITFIALALLCIESMLACSVCAADLSAVNFKQAGKFITALARDDRGRVWIGTEDEGVLVCDPAGDGKLTQFTAADGLGDDNAYALACDGQGRIWAGNLRHGVSVYNGVFCNQLLRRSIWRRFNMFVSM